VSRPRAAQAGRAAALLATTATLLATAPAASERLPLDASTSCGPAALLSLQVDGAQAPAVHDQAFLRLVLFGVGLARDAGPWETEASLLVGSHTHRFPARYGLGPQDPSDAAVGLRLGAGRWLGGGASRLAPWLDVSMTVAWSGASDNRVREVESRGVVALVAVSFGGGVALRSRSRPGRRKMESKLARMSGRLARRAGRAAALVAAAAVLSATSFYSPPPIAFDAATSCGPAGALTLTQSELGCRGDETLRVAGGPEAGLPQWAISTEDDVLVFVGDVTLPGSDPPLAVRRVCRAEFPVDGVRAIACEGEAPEAACSGTLTERPAEENAP
jgi:hypothetical protein